MLQKESEVYRFFVLFSDGKDATRMSAGMLWTGLRTFIGTRRMRRRAFCEFVLPPSLWGDKDHWAELLEPLFGHDLADQPPIVMKQLKAMKAYDATPRLAELQDIPTLIVGAKFDRIANTASHRASREKLSELSVHKFRTGRSRRSNSMRR